MSTTLPSQPPRPTAARRGDGTARFRHLWLVVALIAVVGCDDAGSSTAVDVLGSPDSRFADFDRDSWLVPMRPVTANDPTNMTYDLSLLSPRHFTVVVLDGARLRDYFQTRGLDIDQQLLGSLAQSLSLKQLRSVVVALDDQMANGLMGGGSSQGWLLQVDFFDPPNAAAWNRWLLGPTAATAQVGTSAQGPATDGTAGPLLAADKSFAIQWRSPTQLLVASEAELAKVIKGTADNGGSELVADVLAQSEPSLLFFSLRAAPLQQLVEQISQMAATFGGANTEVQTMFDAVRSLEKIQFSADLQAEDLLRLQLNFLDANAAKTVQSILNQSIGQLMTEGLGAAGGGFPLPGPNGDNPGLSQELQKLLRELQAELAQGGLTATLDGRVVDLQAARPRRLDDVIDQGLASITVVQAQVAQREKLRMLGIALQKFYQAHGRYPAESASPLSYRRRDQVTTTATGPATANQTAAGDEVGDAAADEVDNEAQATDVAGPPFSWRVALLPYLGYPELYEAFDFSQPWDSPDNRRVAASMPVVFDWERQPEVGPETLVSQADGGIPTSDFQFLVGNLGALGATPMVTADQIGDGADRTLMLAQTPQQRSPWSGPAGWAVNTPADLARWQNSPQPPPALMFSGRAVRIDRDLPPEVLLGWVTPNGKERVNRQLVNEATLYPPLSAE